MATAINYFEGITGLVSAETIKPGQRLSISIVGKPKTGKSWFAATAPGPVLVYDFDNRAESLSGKPGVMVKTLMDDPKGSPTAFKEIEKDLSMLKYRASLGAPIPATYVFDSVTYLSKVIENELFTQGVGYRSIKISPTTSIKMRKDWDGINGTERALLYLISEYETLGNIIFVWHEKPEKDVTESDGAKGITKYTNQITVDPQFLAKILSRFNEVYRIEIDGSGKRLVTVQPCYEFTASTTLKNLAEKELPNIQDMIKKSNK